MINDYLNTFQSKEQADEPQVQPGFWDHYLDKLLKHLVIEFSFDFKKISDSLCNLDNQKFKNVKVNEDIIRSRWAYLHIQRKRKKEEKKLTQAETNQNLFNNLMSRLEELKVDNSIPLEYFKNEEQPSDFNILKDSIRGGKEKEAFKQKELDFLKNLDNLNLDDEENKIDKPLFFKAQFLDEKTITFTKEILSKEKADEILSKRIDFSKASEPYEPNLILEKDSLFSQQPILIEDFLQDKETEEKNNDKNQSQEKIEEEKPPEKNEDKKSSLLDEIKLEEERKNEDILNEEIILNENENLKKIEKGIFSIDEVENELDQINRVFCKFDNQKIKEVPKNNFLQEEEKKFDSFAKSQMILNSIESFKNPKYFHNPKSNPSSEEEEEDDFFEIQRQQIKNPSGDVSSITKEKLKKKKINKNQKEANEKDQEKKAEEEDLPLIAKILNNRNNKNVVDVDVEKQLEKEENNDETEFLASKKFKQQLIFEELERKKREEREKNLKELKLLEEKFKHDIEENKRKKKEKKKKMLDEKAMQILEERKLSEQQHRDIELKLFEEREEQRKKEEQAQIKAMITAKSQELIEKLTKFKTNSYLSHIHDDLISTALQISSLPPEALSLLENLKEYEISRFGITKRFQILILPFFPCKSYISEIFSFFLTNSFLFKERVPSKKRFPFFLASFLIASYSQGINDGPREIFNFSRYLESELSFDLQIEMKNFKKCLFLFFDTYPGDSDQIFEKSLSWRLEGNILSKSCLSKLIRKKYINCDGKDASELIFKDLKVAYFKTMEITKFMFHHINTFHPVCVDRSIDGKERNEEMGMLFLKKYGVVEKEGKSVELLSLMIEKGRKNGLDMIGMRTIYFNEETRKNFSFLFENFKVVDANKPFVVILFSGTNAISKLEQIIGCDDPYLAKKLQPNSLNAVFSFEKENSITSIVNKNLIKKLVSYFFGGRHPQLNDELILNIINEEKEQNKEKEKMVTLYPETKEFNPIFLINTSPIQEITMILPYIYKRETYGEIIKIINEFSFVIKEIKLLSEESIIEICNENESLNEYIKKINYYQIDSINKEEIDKGYLCIKIEGVEFAGIKERFKKILNEEICIFNEKDYFFFLKNDKIFSEKMFESKWHNIHQYFTKFNSCNYFVSLNNVSQHHHLDFQHISQQLEFFTTNDFEIIGFENKNINFSCSNESAKNEILEMFKENIKKNINFSPYFKKKKEFFNFLDILSKFLINNSMNICFYRLQKNLDEINFGKFIENLYKNEIFKNSLQNCNENLISSIMGKKSLAENKEDFINQNFDLFFLKIDFEDLINFSCNLNIQLIDDKSIKDSIVFDFPSNGENEFRSVILINQSLLKNLTLHSILKKIMNEKLSIEYARKIKLSSNKKFSKYIKENIETHFNKYEELNNSKLQFFHALELDYFLILIVKGEDSIRKSKRIINFLITSLMLFQNTSSFDLEHNYIELIKLKFEYGIYSSLNYEASLSELDFLQNQQYQENNENIYIDQNQNNILSLLLKTENSENLQSSLMNVFDSKLKIDELFILKINDDLYVNSFIGLFKSKYDVSNMFKYLSSNSNGYLCVIILDGSSILSLNELFGTYKINDKGEMISLMKGKILKNDNKNLITYSEGRDIALKILQNLNMLNYCLS